MANRRFEMFEYRQVLTRMRLGDTDRAIARVGLMGVVSRFVSWNPQGSSPVCSVDGLPGMPSQPARALRRRRRGILSPLPLPRAPTPCAPVRRRRARWRTHLHHNHRDHRGIGARVRAGSPTMTGQCEKSTHGRSEINREIRYENYVGYNTRDSQP